MFKREKWEPLQFPVNDFKEKLVEKVLSEPYIQKKNINDIAMNKPNDILY